MPELIVSLKGRELSRHPLRSETRVGRDPSLEVVIDNPGVSRHHATIVHDGGRYVIRDEQSANGMFVGEQRVSEHVLNEADVVQLGKFALSFTGLAIAPESVAEVSNAASRKQGMVKTFALNAVEVQNVLAAHAGRTTAEAPTRAEVEAEPSERKQPVWLWVGLAIAIAAVVGLLVFR